MRLGKRKESMSGREEEGEHVKEGEGKRKENVSGKDKGRGRRACQGGRREEEGECVRKR